MWKGDLDYTPNVVTPIGTPMSYTIPVNTTTLTLPSFSSLFSDPEGQTLTYSVVSSVAGKISSNAGNVLTLNLGNSDTSFTVTVKATDSKYSQESAGVTFTIYPYLCATNCDKCFGSSSN